MLPSDSGDADRLLRSLDAAKNIGFGDFGSVEPVAAEKHGTSRDALAAAAGEAVAGGFDWLLAVTAAETVTPDIFVKTQPALRLNDAVWGAAGLATNGVPSPKIERITRLAAQDVPTFFHAALRWWIGSSHFVRPPLAAEALRGSDTAAWYADYMIALWKRGNAYKTAQRLTDFHAALPALGDADRARLIASLEEEPVFAKIQYDGRALLLPYTGLNPVIEREQMRGLFFEEDELAYLAARLPAGLRIVDVGANTGNHTLFFATVMRAKSVLPIEPLPRAVAALRAVVAENGLANVDLSRLGKAVGSKRGMLRPVLSATAGLGATHFVPDAAGTIPVAPLDALVEGPVDFVKIDVEGMEMQVLAGAARLIAAQHPILYVEVVDERIAEFMAWVDSDGYRVEKLFPDKTHCNYLLVPGESSKGVVA